TVTSAPLGAELTVHLRVRTTDGSTQDNVAVLDLLPGGFEVQRESLRQPTPSQDASGEGEGEDEESEGGGGGGWKPDDGGIREDRVVVYGAFSGEMREITYKVKLTSPGKFIVPAVYAGAMYNHRVFGHSTTGSFEVTDVK